MSKEEIKILIYKYYMAKTIIDIANTLKDPAFIEKLKIMYELSKALNERR